MKDQRSPPLGRNLIALLATSALFLSVAASNGATETISSGLDQLVVIKPGAHERGLPAVRFEPAGPEGGVVVDIPPTLHVHRFYYDGDREYQGPIIQGGPTVVVANHPKTGEKMYINVTLPSGAPTIAYSGKAITYVYSDRRVRIKFGSLFHDSVAVNYLSGKGLRRNATVILSSAVAQPRNAIASSAAVQSIAEASSDSKKMAVGAVSALDTAISQVVDGAKSLVGSIPGVSPLSSMADEAQQNGYEARVRGLSRKFDASSVPTVRTNR